MGVAYYCSVSYFLVEYQGNIEKVGITLYDKYYINTRRCMKNIYR